MACRISSPTSSTTEISDLHSCNLDDVTEVITALCGNDTTVDSPIPKSFRLEIFSLNSQEMPEDAEMMEDLVHRTLEHRGLRGPLEKLRGYRDVGVQCSTFWKRVGGREVLHEGISIMPDEWKAFGEFGPEDLGDGGSGDDDAGW